MAALSTVCGVTVPTAMEVKEFAGRVIASPGQCGQQSRDSLKMGSLQAGTGHVMRLHISAPP
jgi:hypothetical protein